MAVAASAADPIADDPFALKLIEPGLRALYRHWLKQRGRHSMPARKALDPTAIPETLPNLFLYEYDAARDRFYCRLAGEHINAMVGSTCTRRHLDEIFRPSVFKVVEARYRAIIGRPTLLHMHGIVRMANSLDVPGERLILPLASDGARADALIGAAYYNVPRPGAPTAAWIGEEFVGMVEPGLPPIGWELPQQG